MEYRKLPHGEEMVSVIGMGSSVVGEQKEEDIIKTVEYALDAGVNYFDMAGGHASIFPAYGKVMARRRKEAMLQVHFGANYVTGEYGWTTDLETVKRSVDWQLKNLQTEYIDFGFIHCLDEEADLRAYEKHGILKFIQDMQDQGVVKHIGLSTHAPELANKVLDMGILDVMMFSINPMYDFGRGDFAIGAAGERQDLYRRCEKEGVGITVMKPFNAGQLLDAAKSPFHQALTPAQCIQYALDKPGVLTVLGGPGNIEQLKEILTYLDTTEEERDYSVIGSFVPDDSVGKCVYCRHCHPCPAGLDIALINKYYDLSLQGDVLAKEHYLTLEKTASDCIHCGHCSKRCPFKVGQQERMETIKAYFGRQFNYYCVTKPIEGMLMKILEAIQQDENNKWIFLMGLLQVVTYAVTYWFNISNPNIMMLGSKGILTPLIPNCYVLCTLAILKTFVIRSFFFKKWLLTHVFGGSQGQNSSCKQACVGF